MPESLSTDHVVIGYDAREMWLPYPGSWPESRLRDALIRSDVLKPLAVDDRVWPSPFDIVNDWPVADEASRPTVQLPDWTGSNFPTWDSLIRLASFCKTHQDVLPRPYWLIAVTVLTQYGANAYVDSTPVDQRLLYLDACDPPVVNLNWRFLGYDIADAARLSGLSNCFYSHEDSPIRRAMHGHVNVCHLFDDLDSADSFRKYRNHRTPEHAPFFVYGLYHVSTMD